METMSLPGAAFVVAHGVKMPRVEDAMGRSKFVFEDDPRVQRLLEDYRDGESVSGRDYYRALQDIRVAINRTKSGGAR